MAIEAFPINIISNLPDDTTRGSIPSGKGGEGTFESVFTGQTSEGPSTPSKSRMGEKASVRLPDDHAPETNLIGISAQVTVSAQTQTQTQSQEISASSQGPLSQKLGLYGEGGIQSSVMDVLLQLGFTQEEIDGLAGAKDLGNLKAFLLKLGLNASEMEEFAGCNPSTLEGEGEQFLNKLMNLLEQKGLPPGQLSEIREMLAGLKMELPQVDKLVAVGEQPQQGIKDLLLQLGIHPEEAEKIMEEGEISVDRLSKILLKLGINSEDVHKLVGKKGGQIHNLKQVLINAGVNPEEINKLLEAGENQCKKVSLKELLMVLLNKNIQGLSDKGVAHHSEKDETSSGNNGTSHNGQGEIGLNGRGHIDSGAVVSKGVEVGKAQVDFEKVMSRAELRETTPQKVVEQVVKAVRLQVVNGQTRARITLQPPALGKLQMHIITSENQVRATFFAENAQVKEIIENNLHQLRESFQQQGLKVEHFNVFVGSQPGGNQTEQQRFLDAGTFPRLEGEGRDGEDGLAVEIMRKRALGNHTVDLFV